MWGLGVIVGEGGEVVRLEELGGDGVVLGVEELGKGEVVLGEVVGVEGVLGGLLGFVGEWGGEGWGGKGKGSGGREGEREVGVDDLEYVEEVRGGVGVEGV